jgi:hypothetical protein
MAKKQGPAKAAAKVSPSAQHASPSAQHAPPSAERAPTAMVPSSITVGEMMRGTMHKPAVATMPEPPAATSGSPENVMEMIRAIGKTPAPARFEAPQGWAKLPLELRPFWSPQRSTRPLQGILFAQTRLEVEQITVLAFKLTAETDVVLPNGQSGVGRVGQEVLVPQFYALGAAAQLLSRQDVYYQVFIGNQAKVDLGASDEGTPLTMWELEVRVNPQAMARQG